MQRRVIKLHLALDARRPDDAKILSNIDRVLEQRSLANSWLAVHHKDAAATLARGGQQALEHRLLALSAEQQPSLHVANHPRSMPPASRTKAFLDSIDGDDGQHEVRCTPWLSPEYGVRDQEGHDYN